MIYIHLFPDNLQLIFCMNSIKFNGQKCDNRKNNNRPRLIDTYFAFSVYYKVFVSSYRLYRRMLYTLHSPPSLFLPLSLSLLLYIYIYI